MAQQTQKTKKTSTTDNGKKSSYASAIDRINAIMANYANLPMDSVYSAFGRAVQSWANFAPLQHSRILGINPLPADISKEELGEFLRSPQNNEAGLQRVSEGLRWTNYSYNKIISSYSNMLAFHTMTLPQYVTNDEIKSDSFKREYRLVNKFLKALNIKSFGRKVAAQALTQGKVFYILRYSVDKSHNSIGYVFPQQLPQRYCIISGFNNISNYTISFDLTYFLQPGTDYRQFGSFFSPYMDDFDEWYSTPESERKAVKREKFVYASRNNEKIEGERTIWMQNGKWMYYISLPIDKVWTFEIENQSPIVASPFSGLMQTFAQQADYEAAQLSLILNPLIKIFTGEIPYYQSNQAKEDDGYRLSIGGRALFEALWQQAMNASNTAGTTFFTAPVENIRAWDYGEAANANSVSQSFLNYGMSKTNLTALLPTTDNPHMGVAEYSAKLESQFATQIYRTMERMLEYIINEQLGLKYEYSVRLFGSVYTDDILEANCLKRLATGDLTARLTLLALHDMSIFDAITASELVKETGYIDLLIPPATSYTQSSSGSSDNGAPTKDKTEVEQTVIEKKSAGRTVGRE